MADPGFSIGGGVNPPRGVILQNSPKNCMKLKEFGCPGGRASLTPPLDPPMVMIAEV